MLLLFTVAAGEFTGANAIIAEDLQFDMEQYLAAPDAVRRAMRAAAIADKAAALFGIHESYILDAFVDENNEY